MSDYSPPIEDMMFLLDGVFEGKGLGEFDADMVSAILEEAGKVASGVLAPLNQIGDIQGATLKGGAVKTADGFKQAYAEYCAGGWNSVPFEEKYGGQGLPWSIAFPIQEMWQAANMSFGLCPLLNQGATETIIAHGSEGQKQEYLLNMVAGTWTGTMNLTEPQAGSDLGAIKTKAIHQEDGTYLISGQKIYITYGEHDMSDNIIHLVLARTPEAPEGSKGISLFIVPKFLKEGDAYTKRNDVMCVGLEHKMGIHASPTCTMSFGDNGGAIGYLVGEENMGLKYMFTMMNNARLCVGLQGVAVADRALQKAQAYAQDRVQGKSIETGEVVSIDQHPDVERMLLKMEALVQAGRSMSYQAGLFLDQGDKLNVDLMTPIVKSWCTDMAQDVTYMAVQVHGGMGFVEETGVAQYARDARILPIYEGTNGIQALDLTFRKVLKDKGVVLLQYLNDRRHIWNDNEQLLDAVTCAEKATEVLLSRDPSDVARMATPYLDGLGTVFGGIAMAQRAQKLKSENNIVQAYMDYVLPQARASFFMVAD